MSLPLVVLLPFLGALAAPLFAQGGRTAIAVISCVPAIIGLAALYPHWAILADGGIVQHTTEWLPAIGLSFSFRLDGLSLLFYPADPDYRAIDHPVRPLLPEAPRERR